MLVINGEIVVELPNGLVQRWDCLVPEEDPDLLEDDERADADDVRIWRVGPTHVVNAVLRNGVWNVYGKSANNPRHLYPANFSTWDEVVSFAEKVSDQVANIHSM